MISLLQACYINNLMAFQGY